MSSLTRAREYVSSLILPSWFLCVWVFSLHVCLGTICMSVPIHTRLKREQDPLGLELQVTVSQNVSVETPTLVL